MTINSKASIYELQAAFLMSDGCVAIVDDTNKLIGLFGQKENLFVTTKMVDQYDKGIKIDDVINKEYSKLILTENFKKDKKVFFETTGFSYVPIVTKEGKFIRFEKNLSRSFSIEKEMAEKKKIALKWNKIDKIECSLEEKTYRCLICDNEIDTTIAEKKICVCLFGGGKLVRYKCQNCEGITGPLKMLNLSKEELAEDYIQHYGIFQEGDTTEDEIRTFFKLNPQIGKKYLNYGCGGEWSKSLIELRKQGYDVYGYEPYATSSNVDYVFTQYSQMEGMKFDGIFSNNLIEHLSNPVKELMIMKSFLQEEGVMAHATACYEYLYPYTRFHLCFPIGKSAEIMFQRAGLELVERSETILHGDKQICIVVKNQNMK